MTANRDPFDVDGELDAGDDPVGGLEAPGPMLADTAGGLEAWRRLLEVNGYNAIKAATLAGAQAIGPLPPEAIDAAVKFTEQAIARLAVDTNPQAAAARRRAEYDLEVLEACRRFRRDLGRIDKRQAARDSIARP